MLVCKEEWGGVLARIGSWGGGALRLVVIGVDRGRQLFGLILNFVSWSRIKVENTTGGYE